SHKSEWKWTRKNLAKNPNFVYCSDEHFYVSPEWLYSHVNVYDEYPRDGGLVYAGEYAAHVPGSGCALFNAPQANVWEGALAEAAFMTGMERNADIVVMKSYAPLFARLGYTQWSPDMIWFNGKTAYGSPSYYVQKLYSLYTGDDSLKTTVDGKGVYASATERDAFVYVKVVNSGAEEVPVEVEGDFDFGSLTRIIRLSGELSDYNTVEEPDKISPVDVAPVEPRSLTLAPYSFQVLVFKK
ncbi:MAG: alpha-L-arabinofuranosidase, partial [Clostridia bacterium]|nr:alpha-L-arabinofuranosidase [Clostridia bacterium]